MEDPFELVVPEEKLNPHFKQVASMNAHAPARYMIKKVAKDFIDRDGNFREQFQTEGFDARIWELYLFAYFRDAGLSEDRTEISPDFVLTKDGKRIAVEAVTTGPSKKAGEEVEKSTFEEKQGEYVKKLGRALRGKLKKKYWELEHVKGAPLVLAVEAFHCTDALVFADSLLTEHLYGKKTGWEYDSDGKLKTWGEDVEGHQVGENVVASGFFSFPGAEHVSAVLFNNSGTEPKFNRMGYLEGVGRDDILMLRYGTCYDPDPDATVPLGFVYQVGHPSFPESWGQGTVLMHNQKCLCPIDKQELFPNACHMYVKDGMLCPDVPPFHPYGSQTLVLACEGLGTVRLPARVGPLDAIEEVVKTFLREMGKGLERK